MKLQIWIIQIENQLHTPADFLLRLLIDLSFYNALYILNKPDGFLFAFFLLLWIVMAFVCPIMSPTFALPSPVSNRYAYPLNVSHLQVPEWVATPDKTARQGRASGARGTGAGDEVEAVGKCLYTTLHFPNDTCES